MQTNKKSLRELVYEVPILFLPYVSAAITRLGYIFPEITFVLDEGMISATSKNKFDEEHLEKEIAHTLYREKIYQETLPARLSLVQALTR